MTAAQVPSPSPSRALNSAFGLLAILLWSTSVAFGRNVSHNLGPMTAGAFIYLAGGIVGTIYLIATRTLAQHLAPENFKYVFGCGSCFVTFCIVFYFALAKAANNTQILEVGLINYLWPMLTLLFSLWLLSMRANLLFPLGAVLSMAGIVLALNQNGALTWQSVHADLHLNWPPYLLAFVAAISWGAYSALSRRWGSRSGGGAVPLFMLAAGIIMLCARFPLAEHSSFSRRTILELLFVTVGSNSAYVLWDLAVRRGDLVLVASASYFTPLLSTLFSCLYLNVPTNSRIWIACLFVLTGAILCKLAIKPTTLSPSPAPLTPLPELQP